MSNTDAYVTHSFRGILFTKSDKFTLWNGVFENLEMTTYGASVI